MSDWFWFLVALAVEHPYVVLALVIFIMMFLWPLRRRA